MHIPGRGLSCGCLIAANGGEDKVDQEPRPSLLLLLLLTFLYSAK